MADRRLKDEAWRARVGFDNIDPKPYIPVESPRHRPTGRLSSRRISAQIDRELFGKDK